MHSAKLDTCNILLRVQNIVTWNELVQHPIHQHLPFPFIHQHLPPFSFSISIYHHSHSLSASTTIIILYHCLWPFSFHQHLSPFSFYHCSTIALWLPLWQSSNNALRCSSFNLTKVCTPRFIACTVHRNECSKHQLHSPSCVSLWPQAGVSNHSTSPTHGHWGMLGLLALAHAILGLCTHEFVK